MNVIEHQDTPLQMFISTGGIAVATSLVLRGMLYLVGRVDSVNSRRVILKMHHILKRKIPPDLASWTDDFTSEAAYVYQLFRSERVRDRWPVRTCSSQMLRPLIYRAP